MNIRIEHVTQETKEGVIPLLKFEIFISNREQSAQIINLLLATSKITMQGQKITSSEPTIIGGIVKNNNQISFSTEFSLPRNTIEAIEGKRVDDLSLNLDIKLLYSYQVENRNNIETTNLGYNLKYSQKEWSTLLHKIGYFESWVMEIARPRIEGLDVVVQHLQKASDSLDSKDYENCMANSRIAWDALKPLLNSKWEHIQKLIDEGSPGESNHDPKSKRVKEIGDKIHYLSNVGIHRENYRVFPEDAILCYHLTVSMMAYLSRWLRNAP